MVVFINFFIRSITTKVSHHNDINYCVTLYMIFGVVLDAMHCELVQLGNTISVCSQGH